MAFKISIGIVLFLLLVGGGSLYLKDSATVEQALQVEEFLTDYCRLNKRYPEIQALENKFPALYPGGEWYYWPDEARTSATFQYPMTLPLPSAPGRSKLSEFFPVIYSYAVHHPCKDLF